MLYHYNDTSFNGSSVYTLSSAWKTRETCGSSIPLPSWSRMVSNRNVPRGIRRGVPSDEASNYSTGCWSYMDTGEIPPTQVIPVANQHERSLSPYKEYQRMKREGKVILNPILHNDIQAVRHPGFVAASAGSLLNVTLRPISESPQRLEGIDPCNGTQPPTPVDWGWHNSFGGVPLDREIWGSIKLSTNSVRRRWSRWKDPQFYYPDLDPLHEAIPVIQSFLEREYDSGLITSTVAEANSEIFDALTALGESKETIGFIFGSLRSIIEHIVLLTRALSKVRKDPAKGAAQVADEIARLWLEFRYAINPLVMSVNDALDALNSSFAPYLTTRDGLSVNFEDTELSNGWTLSGFKAVDRCFVKTQIGKDSLGRGMKMNLLSTAWELVPLSFLVDWVLNIGDYLSTIQAPSDILNRGIQASRSVENQTVLISVPGQSQYGFYEVNLRYYRANPLTTRDLIGLSVSFDLSWRRWLDAIALSWGASRALLKDRRG